jgi:hypothetical protein
MRTNITPALMPPSLPPAALPLAPSAPTELPYASTAAKGRLEPRPAVNEELLGLAELARRLPKIDGRKVAIPTIWRWCRKGLRGVRLQYTRVGRRICVSPDALSAFFAQVAALDERVPPPGRPVVLGKRPVTSKQRLRALAEADRVLAGAGI